MACEAMPGKYFMRSQSSESGSVTACEAMPGKYFMRSQSSESGSRFLALMAVTIYMTCTRTLCT